MWYTEYVNCFSKVFKQCNRQLSCSIGIYFLKNWTDPQTLGFSPPNCFLTKEQVLFETLHSTWKRFSNPKNGLECRKTHLVSYFSCFLFAGEFTFLWEEGLGKLFFWTPVLNPQISHIHGVPCLLLLCTAKLDLLQSPPKGLSAFASGWSTFLGWDSCSAHSRTFESSTHKLDCCSSTIW